MLSKSDIVSALQVKDISAGRSDYDLNPDMRKILKESRTLRAAAVLCPLIKQQDNVSIILTQRPKHLKAHAGQISFPGGKIENFDSSPLDAALREADEEIGLKSGSVETLGELAPYETGTQFLVSPFVGWITPDFKPLPDPNEVQEVFQIPLSFILDRHNLKVESYENAGVQRKFYVYNFQGYYIWGATAGMLKNLSDRILTFIESK